MMYNVHTITVGDAILPTRLFFAEMLSAFHADTAFWISGTHQRILLAGFNLCKSVLLNRFRISKNSANRGEFIQPK